MATRDRTGEPIQHPVEPTDPKDAIRQLLCHANCTHTDGAHRPMATVGESTPDDSAAGG